MNIEHNFKSLVITGCDGMKDKENSGGILKLGAVTLLKTVIAVIICNFVCLSLQMVATSLFTEVRGYSVYGYKGDNADNAVFLYEHYNSDGEDGKIAEYEADGYTLQKRSIRTKMFTSGKIAFLTVAQISCFVTLFGFVYPPLWRCGTADSNAVAFGRRQRDRFKGLKIGLLASIPTFAIFAVFVSLAALGKTASTDAYIVFNAHLFSLLRIVFSGRNDFSLLNALQYALVGIMAFFLPILTQISYELGFRNISVSQKIMYKKGAEN